MDFLLFVGILLSFISLFMFIGNLVSDSDDNIICNVAYIFLLVGTICILIGEINIQADKSYKEGFIDGTTNPQNKQIKEIRYKNGIPSDTLYVIKFGSKKELQVRFRLEKNPYPIDQLVEGMDLLLTIKIKIMNLNKLIDREQFDKDCSFSNGKGYIQQDIELVNKLKEELHTKATKFINDKSIEYINSENWLQFHTIEERPLAIEKAKNTTYNKNFIGRYLDGMNLDLYKIWSRLQNIDELGREWGQMYYRLNPEKAQQVQLNK